MDLYPAIDLRGGRCVRLRQGDYAQETVYGDDPVAVAVGFAEAGCRWIHVVDLDAARTGEPVNRPVIAAVCAAVAPLGAAVQTGGGVRAEADAEALAAAGVARAVMGTAALRDPALVTRCAAILPITVGLDHRNGELAVHGWTEGSGQQVLDVLGLYAASASAFVVTEIGRDGMLTGPDVAGLADVLAATEVPVIASGGVGTLDDVRALATTLPGLEGVITGKALYEGRFSVAQALSVLAAGGA
jgi:phosphoribosylformimino-5-aminoimidazole carboxamide ribotide isomerase